MVGESHFRTLLLLNKLRSVDKMLLFLRILTCVWDVSSCSKIVCNFYYNVSIAYFSCFMYWSGYMNVTYLFRYRFHIFLPTHLGTISFAHCHVTRVMFSIDMLILFIRVSFEYFLILNIFVLTSDDLVRTFKNYVNNFGWNSLDI